MLQDLAPRKKTLLLYLYAYLPTYPPANLSDSIPLLQFKRTDEKKNVGGYIKHLNFIHIPYSAPSKLQINEILIFNVGEVTWVL